MYDTTALTRSSTSGESYLTRASTSGTSYGTIATKTVPVDIRIWDTMTGEGNYITTLTRHTHMQGTYIAFGGNYDTFGGGWTCSYSYTTSSYFWSGYTGIRSSSMSASNTVYSQAIYNLGMLRFLSAVYGSTFVTWSNPPAYYSSWTINYSKTVEFNYKKYSTDITGTTYLTRSSTYGTNYLTRSSISGYTGKSSSSKSIEISSWL